MLSAQVSVVGRSSLVVVHSNWVRRGGVLKTPTRHKTELEVITRAAWLERNGRATEATRLIEQFCES